MERRKYYIKKDVLSEKELNDLAKIEEDIANLCEDSNKEKIIENFKQLGTADGNVNHQGIWKVKKKIFPKVKPVIQTGKKNLMNQLITNPAELKELYIESFIHRLRHRPCQSGFEEF